MFLFSLFCLILQARNFDISLGSNETSGEKAETLGSNPITQNFNLVDRLFEKFFERFGIKL